MPIDSKIRQLLKQQGYITVDHMMREVLSTHPSSYYRTQNILGREGDFITAPEISQLFGEIIGLWAIEQWENLGRPSALGVVELGPGSGVLMRDLLRIARLVPEFYRALTVQLIDINPHFIKQQKTNLQAFNTQIKWPSRIEEIKEIPSIIIANEFFDALPIKQYVKVKELWYESIFILDPLDGKIKFDKISVHKELQYQLLHDHPHAFDGAIIEESLESLEITRAIARHISRFNGSSIIIDYGYYMEPLTRTRYQYSPTLQAVKNHGYSSLLETLGESDLSAHVDFYALRKTASERNMNSNQLTSQGEFLVNYGIKLRSELLKKELSSEKANIIDRQVQRLISNKQMGNLFKVFTFANQKKLSNLP